MPSTNSLKTLSPLILKRVDLLLQVFDRGHGLVDRCPELSTVRLPALNTLVLGRSSTNLGVDLVAKLALLLHPRRRHDELHAARLAASVFPVAVLTEMAPLPVAALEDMLVEETHLD